MNRTITIHFIFLLIAKSAWTAPDWPHPATAQSVVLRVDHAHSFDGAPAEAAKWIIPSEKKHSEVLKPGAVVTNLELWLFSVVEFPKKTLIDSSDEALLKMAFDEAEWVDVYDDGVIGNAPLGHLVFIDTEDPDLAWIVEFWEKSVRLLPAMKCGEHIYQSMIMGRSTALNGEVGGILGELGRSLLPPRSKP